MSGTGFAVGDLLRHEGEVGVFEVKKIRENGDLDCWGGLGGPGGVKENTGHASFRTFRQSDCRPAKLRKLHHKVEGDDVT